MLTRYPTRRSWIVGAFVIAAVMAATRFAVNDTATATEQATAITKTEQLRDNLQKALDAAEAQLKPLRANVQALPGQAEKSLREKLDDARRQLEAQKGRVQPNPCQSQGPGQAEVDRDQGSGQRVEGEARDQ